MFQLHYFFSPLFGKMSLQLKDRKYCTLNESLLHFYRNLEFIFVPTTPGIFKVINCYVLELIIMFLNPESLVIAASEIGWGLWHEGDVVQITPSSTRWCFLFQCHESGRGLSGREAKTSTSWTLCYWVSTKIKYQQTTL